MKRTASFFPNVILFSFFCILLLPAAKKDQPSESGSNKSGDSTNSNSICSASNLDAENIMIFPSDNPCNQDISGDSVDPSSDQVIANFSTAPLKADLG